MDRVQRADESDAYACSWHLRWIQTNRGITLPHLCFPEERLLRCQTVRVKVAAVVASASVSTGCLRAVTNAVVGLCCVDLAPISRACDYTDRYFLRTDGMAMLFAQCDSELVVYLDAYPLSHPV